MSLRSSRWTLWVLMFCTAPVPYMLGGLEKAPPLRLLLFTLLTVAVQVAEGPGGYVWNTFIALGVVQLALYAVGLYLCASLVTRALTRLTPRRRLAVVAAVCVVAVSITSAFPLYETPMSSRAMYSDLGNVLR